MPEGEDATRSARGQSSVRRKVDDAAIENWLIAKSRINLVVSRKPGSETSELGR